MIKMCSVVYVISSAMCVAVSVCSVISLVLILDRRLTRLWTVP